ncbi:MAG: CDP-glucose 4,6-dehydratase [Chloroflexota bacterium]|nr:CDP-glucose 4,6-dehydratase [Chloroflexota bacterium]
MEQAPRILAPPAFGSSFAGRRVLVTGHTGFKGSWLAIWLHALGATVTGYSLGPPTQPNNFQAANVRALLASQYIADVRDREALLGALRSSEPDVVLHLAARSVVRDSYANPLETISSNVIGTATVLDAIRELARPCAVVVVSSDKCYANDESGRPFVEDDRLGGADPYSASKAAVELVTDAYRRSFFPPEDLCRHGIAVATARAGNVVGGGDWTPDGLVADVMRALLARTPVLVRHPTAIRPWQHVLEPLGGYLTLTSHLLGPDAMQFCSGWNFGPCEQDSLTVAQLVETILREWGDGTWQDVSRPDDPPEAGVLRLSTAKAAASLGWRSYWRTDEALVRTVAWYRRFEANPTTARQACLEDVAVYTRTAN